jgi:histidinol phosphatase-like enzyme
MNNGKALSLDRDRTINIEKGYVLTGKNAEIGKNLLIQDIFDEINSD